MIPGSRPSAPSGRLWLVPGGILLVVVALSCSGDRPSRATSNSGTPTAPSNEEPHRTFQSDYLGTIDLLPGIPPPSDAEAYVFPLMKDHAEDFAGKRVLEIGASSGVLGLHAARLGAAKVVVIGADEAAVRNAEINAKRLRVASVVEARLTSPDDPDVYSGLEPNERFDVIVSIPPFSLDLKASESTAALDNGLFGPSLVRDLEDHLNPEGVAIFLYNSLFYHYTMVKLARHFGYVVREHGPSRMTSPEATTLYNAYLARFLEHEGIDPAAFSFDGDKEKLGCIGVKTEVEPLFSGNSSRAYHGMIVIRGKRGPSRNEPTRTAPAEDPTEVSGERRAFRSAFFETPVVLLPGVFPPMEAEGRVLPFMREYAGLFKDASVLDIGTGSGMIALYAAKLGARQVVATDINETAVRNAGLNAENLGVAGVFEARLVPQDDMSAYSVIGPDERFDVIISNPPYSLDLDAPGNTAETDQGDLGFSIVQGLDRHLNPGGVAVLLYPSIFYHHVMVKYARFDGFEVRDHAPLMMTPLEGAALFNTYLSGFLARAGVEPDAFGFDQEIEPHMLGCFGYKGRPDPLLPGGSSRLYAGMIVIRRDADGSIAD